MNEDVMDRIANDIQRRMTLEDALVVDTHYGANGHGECGAGAEDGSARTSVIASEVTCQTCRGWLPIVAHLPQADLSVTAAKIGLVLEHLDRMLAHAPADERRIILSELSDALIKRLYASQVLERHGQ